MLSDRTKFAFTLLVILAVFCFSAQAVKAAIERTLTDNGRSYTPQRQFARINFEEELGVENTSLQDLGKIIDDGFKYSDPSLLNRAAVILGYQEKQWNTSSRYISAIELENKAVEIACYKKDTDALKAIINAYDEQSLSFYNPEKAKELQDFTDKITASNNRVNKGTIIVYNNTRRDNLFIYIDDIFAGKIPRNGIMKLKDVNAGRITLSANDDNSTQWGPRKVFLGKDNVFHWKLY